MEALRLPKHLEDPMAASLVRPLVVSPDPLLREVCTEIPYTQFNTPALYEQAGHMIAALWRHSGIGLAANQLGYTNRMIVVVPYPERGRRRQGYPLVMINPRFEVRGSRTQTLSEGCLSFPGIKALRSRAMNISVAYHTLEGAVTVCPGTGYFGQCVQHEIDHLNGLTFLDPRS